MGRGRAKAKQTKVARELKYSTGGTDLERLRAELVGSGNAQENDAVADDEDDPYAAYVDPDEDDDR
ncbi:DUF3073 domain-containing protein [Sporichthya brevicatena]|uniref:DUF3073 domain-containing protein n=1 Tax=Sporichthya brevicatena TaxID=171442 RepID=A0ABP3SD34_9ACTN